MSLNTYPYSPFPASTEQMHKGDNEELQAQIDAIKDGTTIDSFGDVEAALDLKADLGVIAPEFDVTSGVYDVGDLVTYQGKLYEFTTAHDTAGEWDPTEVAEKTVADEIDTVKSGLTTLNAQVNKGHVEVTSDGEKTNGQLLDALFALVDVSKISGSSYLRIGNTIWCVFTISSFVEFRTTDVGASAADSFISKCKMRASGSFITKISISGTVEDTSSTVLASGYKFSVYY